MNQLDYAKLQMEITKERLQKAIEHIRGINDTPHMKRAITENCYPSQTGILSAEISIARIEMEVMLESIERMEQRIAELEDDADA